MKTPILILAFALSAPALLADDKIDLGKINGILEKMLTKIVTSDATLAALELEFDEEKSSLENDALALRSKVSVTHSAWSDEPTTLVSSISGKISQSSDDESKWDVTLSVGIETDIGAAIRHLAQDELVDEFCSQSEYDFTDPEQALVKELCLAAQKVAETGSMNDIFLLSQAILNYRIAEVTGDVGRLVSELSDIEDERAREYKQKRIDHKVAELKSWKASILHGVRDSQGNVESLSYNWVKPFRIIKGVEVTSANVQLNPNYLSVSVRLQGFEAVEEYDEYKEDTISMLTRLQNANEEELNVYADMAKFYINFAKRVAYIEKN